MFYINEQVELNEFNSQNNGSLLQTADSERVLEEKNRTGTLFPYKSASRLNSHAAAALYHEVFRERRC